MSTEKSDGKTQTPEPVESSGWFGDVFISSKISGSCTGNVPAKHAKYTKRNPRILRGPRSKNLSSKLNMLSPPNDQLRHRRALTQQTQNSKANPWC
ncbi:MAG: hypothetical protein DME24_20105 [Verrucomicrobia bacterium]|nr:MAG: hypothetical protein DME24_20105 [Verrucomicrobiota bacterium]